MGLTWVFLTYEKLLFSPIDGVLIELLSSYLIGEKRTFFESTLRSPDLFNFFDLS